MKVISPHNYFKLKIKSILDFEWYKKSWVSYFYNRNGETFKWGFVLDGKGYYLTRHKNNPSKLIVEDIKGIKVMEFNENIIFK